MIVKTGTKYLTLNLTALDLFLHSSLPFLLSLIAPGTMSFSPSHEKDAQLDLETQMESINLHNIPSEHGNGKREHFDMVIDNLDDDSSDSAAMLLPSPAVAAQNQIARQQQKPKLTATVIIPIWIVLSSSVIIYNNYLYNSLDFKYPVFTVTWHLTFAVSTSF